MVYRWQTDNKGQALNGRTNGINVCRRMAGCYVVWVIGLVLLNVAGSLPDNISTGNAGIQRRQNFTISEEKRLTQYLLWKYSVAGKGGRPVVNTSKATTVEFGLGLIQMDLDERNKVLVTSMWTRLKWHDVYLSWNPADFGGIRTVRLESNQIWIPDIMLYNTAEPESGARNALVVVSHDGTLQWVPHQVFRSSCSIDVTNFPFDEQRCNLWFGSWTHSLSDIDLILSLDGGIDLSTFQSDYKDSCEWEIVKSEAERKLLPPDDPNPIAVLSFTLSLQRKLVFSSYILTLPCVFLASLTLVVFWLPPDRPDRTALAMNLFASFLVLLLILVEAAPPTASSVPLLGIYYCFNMTIITLSIFLSTIVVNLSQAGQKGRPPPRWLRLVILKVLAKLVCIFPGGCRKYCTVEAPSWCRSCRRNQHEDGGESCQSNDEASERQRLMYKDVGTDRRTRRRQKAASCQNGLCPDGDCLETDFRVMTQDVRRSLHTLLELVSTKDKESARKKRLCVEWQEIGRVLDRFFFCLYVATVIGSLFTLSPRPPNTGFFWESP